jgi:hypothetical protein
VGLETGAKLVVSGGCCECATTGMDDAWGKAWSLKLCLILMMSALMGLGRLGTTLTIGVSNNASGYV